LAFACTTEAKLFVNKNALSSTFLGNEDYAEGENPFEPNSYDLTTVEEQDGLPTFAATVVGINSTEYPSPYFYLDFTTSNTVAWGVNCTHTALGSYNEGDCSTKPTLMTNVFNGTELPTVTLISDFNDEEMGGYTVSGTKYLTEVCFGGSNC